jgi:ATP-dependent Lhr-like helicase
MSSVFGLLSPRLQEVIQAFGLTEPTPPQTAVIPPLLMGASVLLIAPTGSGKTEAAILPVFDRMLRGTRSEGIQFIYITPLRALNRDMYKRMMAWAEALDITIGVRHSDTTQKERREQSKKPPQMLITTPETLQAILSTKGMRPHLRTVRWVVIDEVHELAASRRGAQLTVGLERLERLTAKPPQRIGLSATLGNPGEIAAFLGGIHTVQVVEVPVDKRYQYGVEYPELEAEDFVLGGDLNTSARAASRLRRIRDLVETHQKTLIFVQGRGQAESLGHKLSLLDPRIDVHHGSLSREQRHIVEDRFKSGDLKAIVCTSTLQLGIDIGDVDLVIQYNSPRQVSTLIQRVGRSGHSLSSLSQGIIIASYGEDALESAVTAENARSMKLEPVQSHVKPLDVLAHQLVGLTLENGVETIEEAFRIISRAYPYRNLTLVEVKDMAEFLWALRVLEVKEDKMEKTKKGQMYYFENLGMINDERRYPFVNVATDRIIGTVGDEFWTLRARVGLNVILRGRVWRIIQIDEDNGRLFVMPSDDTLGALPGWDGELIGVPQPIAEHVDDLREEISNEIHEKGLEETVKSISTRLRVSQAAVRIAAAEVQSQEEVGAPLPGKDRIILESYERWLIIHSGYGSKVNTTLGTIIDAILSDKDLIISWWADTYRILIETPYKVGKNEFEEIAATFRALTPDEAEKRLSQYLDARFPYAYNLKFIAERFGAIPRGKSIGPEELHRIYRRYRNTPIYQETLREVYGSKLDLQSVKQLLFRVNSGAVSVQTHRSIEPSPLARHILEAYGDIEEIMLKGAGADDQLDYMRKSIQARPIRVACVDCGDWSHEDRLSLFSDRPKCEKCGSSLLAVLERSQNPQEFFALLKRHREGDTLTSDELETISRGRKSADLVLSYGRKAMEALSVHGVGPVTAYQILSRMQPNDKTLYNDLLKAKIQYMRTRQYWAERSERMK